MAEGSWMGEGEGIPGWHEDLIKERGEVGSRLGVGGVELLEGEWRDYEWDSY